MGQIGWRKVGGAGALLCLLAAGARADELGSAVRESYATNESMLTQATTAAVAELFMGLALPEGASLLVEPAGDHETNWFVELHLLAYLSDAGYRAYLKQAPLLGPEVPVEVDSLGPNAVPAAGAPRLAGAEPETDYVLRYRVVLCEISYPEKYRRSPLGSKRVQRRTSVSLMAQVLQGKREDVIWVGKGNVERVNIVPSSRLSLLAGNDFPFNPPALEGRGLGSYLEPILVTGIVAGLVFLFYANQD